MGKVALITGGSRGIGAATALTLAREGYDIAVNYVQHHTHADAIVEEIRAMGRRAMAVQADVSNFEAVGYMFEAIEKELGPVEVLVSNAGVAGQMQIQDVSKEDWDRYFGVNINGAFHCVHFALPHMLREHRGVIITVSSIWGLRGASCESVYSATKAALIGFSKSLANELGPTNIRVNCVAPGVIDTDMLDELPEGVKDTLAEDTPLQRLGTPEDIANLIAFLASDKASFLTGQVICADGGFIV